MKMKRLSEKLLKGDYFQKMNYRIRRRIIQLFKEEKLLLLESLLNELNADTHAAVELEGVSAITIFDTLYPDLLLETYDPPLVLYCKGNVELLALPNTLGVVGSRNPRYSSADAVGKIISELAQSDVGEPLVVVSGLAKGIDALSHQHALKNNLPTIAVLGFGFHYMYPFENNKLLQEIIKNGLVISEYPPYIGINKWQFVARNRVIAGLSRALVVIEAKEKSGSLITAELALSENREVFIVGGNSFDSAFYGSNSLIQEGAKLLLKIEEIIAEYTIC